MARIPRSYYLRLEEAEATTFAAICKAQGLTANQGVATLIAAVNAGTVQLYGPSATGHAGTPQGDGPAWKATGLPGDLFGE
jgi:hypothetical protein